MITIKSPFDVLNQLGKPAFDNISNMDKMPKGHYIINSKTVNVKTWWRHRNSDGFTIHEKKAFDNYLEERCIDWSQYDKTNVE